MREQLSEEDRFAIVQYRLNCSNRALAEADYNADGGYYYAAVNRLYYTCYYAVSALLLSYGINAQTHAGARTQLALHFVKDGKLGRNCLYTYQQLFDARQSGDYEDFVICDEEMFSSFRPAVDEFLVAVKELIR